MDYNHEKSNNNFNEICAKKKNTSDNLKFKDAQHFCALPGV